MDYSQEYRQMLANIDGELHEADIKSLKFLCEPTLRPKKLLSNVCSGFEIFDALEKSTLLSPGDLSYLAELLRIIGRIDLACMVEPNSDFDEDSHYIRDSRVCPFRTLLFKLSEDLGSEEVMQLRYLYGKVPKKDTIEEGIDLFSVMLKHQRVSSDDLSLLRQLLQDIHRKDLLAEVEQFANQKGKLHYNDLEFEEIIPVQESSCFQSSPTSEELLKGSTFTQLNITEKEQPMDESQSPTDNCEDPLLHTSESGQRLETYSSPPMISTHPDFSNVSMRLTSCGVDSILSGTEEADEYVPIECYKMDAQPRGFCIVIDNHKFEYNREDREATQLNPREGSSKDADALINSFQRLGFIPQIETNLTDFQMVQLLTNVSQRDHSLYDCFVCCILSHGGDNYVFGKNGRKVSVSRITELFRAQACPSLTGKPKLFFLASCRGKTHQPGVGPLEGDIQHDAPDPEPDITEWIPNEADFLLGYATVPNYVSYRSKSQGTFYISELTKVLDKYGHREDIQTLLLRVNDAVSKRVYQERDKVFKQVPAPQHTLRKQLKFL